MSDRRAGVTVEQNAPAASGSGRSALKRWWTTDRRIKKAYSAKQQSNPVKPQPSSSAVPSYMRPTAASLQKRLSFRAQMTKSPSGKEAKGMMSRLQSIKRGNNLRKEMNGFTKSKKKPGQKRTRFLRNSATFKGVRKTGSVKAVKRGESIKELKKEYARRRFKSAAMTVLACIHEDGRLERLLEAQSPSVSLKSSCNTFDMCDVGDDSVEFDRVGHRAGHRARSRSPDDMPPSKLNLDSSTFINREMKTLLAAGGSQAGNEGDLSPMKAMVVDSHHLDRQQSGMSSDVAEEIPIIINDGRLGFDPFARGLGSSASNLSEKMIFPVASRVDSDCAALMSQQSALRPSLVKALEDMGDSEDQGIVPVAPGRTLLNSKSSLSDQSIAPVALRGDSKRRSLLKNESGLRTSFIRRLERKECSGNSQKSEAAETAAVSWEVNSTGTLRMRSGVSLSASCEGMPEFVGASNADSSLEDEFHDVHGVQSRELTIPFVVREEVVRGNGAGGDKDKKRGLWWDLGVGFLAGAVTAVWFVLLRSCQGEADDEVALQPLIAPRQPIGERRDLYEDWLWHQA